MKISPMSGEQNKNKVDMNLCAYIPQAPEQ